MDKNTLTGLLLIGAIIIGFSIFNAPSDAEIAAAKRKQDSIAKITLEEERRAENAVETIVAKEESKNVLADDTIATSSNVIVDSVSNENLERVYGPFKHAASTKNRTIKVETELLVLNFDTKGGKLDNVILKDYFTYEGLPLVLFDSSSSFNLNFFTKDNKNIFTDELVFETESNDIVLNGVDQSSISFKLIAGPDQYIEFVYGIKADDFLIDFDVNLVGMEQIVDVRTGEMYLNLAINAPNQEKSLKSQREATTIFYEYKGGEMDDLTATSDDKESFESSIKWVSFKQQFFNTTLVADDFFDKSKAYAETITDESTDKYVKKLLASLTIPVEGKKLENFGMSLYMGPNNYNTLGKYDIGLENIINLGWGIFGWVNKFAVIPVFTFLDSFNMNYGIIILILTILLKLVLSPITYKTYLSGAKMRVLKPEINEINEKFKDDAMKKQQAMMGLYRQTGVNPLSGCIPMLIQMPILIAMFRFFPSSIELRQESFLWADDLSSYDSIYNFPDGFSIPFYGDHISLFTLLMAISLMFYTKMNSSMGMGATDGPMASQMKIMTYMMPVMMLFFFNNYSSGLSYYYFLANVISMGQTMLIRKVFINEDAIRAKIETNKKKPQTKKKSGFQKRLEEMAKQKGMPAPKK